MGIFNTQKANSTNEQKQHAARKALDYIKPDMIVGIGTGSTVDFFIDALAEMKGKIEAAVSSSKVSTERLKSLNIPVIDLNSTHKVDVYIDGADEVTPYFQCLKGGGGALTGEKIVASVAKQFICIIDETKRVNVLGQFPLAIEVIPMARSAVARAVVKLGGDPVYRQGFITDHGNIILDVHNLKILDPLQLEQELNNIPGVVCNGLFAIRPADLVLMGTDKGVIAFQ